MNLIVGLGNPGKKYDGTMHNLGYAAVDELAQSHEVQWQEFSKNSLMAKLNQYQTILLKPTTYMNESGNSLKEITNYFKIKPEDLWVIHDELDLPPGEVRLSFNSSAAGHRGVQSIIDQLSSQAFWRFRIGIGRPPGHMPAEDYVLTCPPENLKIVLTDSLAKTSDLLKTALTQGITEAKLKNKNLN